MNKVCLITDASKRRNRNQSNHGGHMRCFARTISRD
jgi:hypothetical protein